MFVSHTLDVCTAAVAEVVAAAAVLVILNTTDISHVSCGSDICSIFYGRMRRTYQMIQQ